MYCSKASLNAAAALDLVITINAIIIITILMINHNMIRDVWVPQSGELLQASVSAAVYPLGLQSSVFAALHNVDCLHCLQRLWRHKSEALAKLCRHFCDIGKHYTSALIRADAFLLLIQSVV